MIQHFSFVIIVMAIYQLELAINGIIHSINGVISTYNWYMAITVTANKKGYESKP